MTEEEAVELILDGDNAYITLCEDADEDYYNYIILVFKNDLILYYEGDAACSEDAVALDGKLVRLALSRYGETHAIGYNNMREAMDLIESIE